MTAEELKECSVWLRNNFYSYKNIAKRLFSYKDNLKNLYNAIIFIKYNLLFREEVFKKSNMKFGYNK